MRTVGYIVLSEGTPQHLAPYHKINDTVLLNANQNNGATVFQSRANAKSAIRRTQNLIRQERLSWSMEFTVMPVIGEP